MEALGFEPKSKNLPAMQEMQGTRVLSLGQEWNRSPEGEHGNPLQYSCLQNPMDRGIWHATIHWVPKSWTLLNTHTHTHTLFKFKVFKVQFG